MNLPCRSICIAVNITYLVSVWISWQINYNIRCDFSGHFNQRWGRCWSQRCFNIVYVMLWRRKINGFFLMNGWTEFSIHRWKCIRSSEVWFCTLWEKVDIQFGVVHIYYWSYDHCLSLTIINKWSPIREGRCTFTKTWQKTACQSGISSRSFFLCMAERVPQHQNRPQLFGCPFW